MASACRIFYRNLNTPLSKMISQKPRLSSIEFIRNFNQEQDTSTTKRGAFAEFYEKTKEDKQIVEEDQDFEMLLRNSNFINVTFSYLLCY